MTRAAVARRTGNFDELFFGAREPCNAGIGEDWEMMPLRELSPGAWSL